MPGHNTSGQTGAKAAREDRLWCIALAILMPAAVMLGVVMGLASR
jgi:hypothetical protein